MSTLTIRIDERLERDLNRLAKAQRRSKSELARQLLREHIALARLDELRRRLQPKAEAVGWLTDEDVFREVS